MSPRGAACAAAIGCALGAAAPAAAKSAIQRPAPAADADAGTTTGDEGTATLDMIDEPPRPPTTPPPDDVDPPPHPEPPCALSGHWRLEGALGFRVGSTFVDGADAGTVLPGHADLGLRRDRWLVYGEYALSSLTYPGDAAAAASRIGPATDGHGLTHRVGAAARYAFGEKLESDGGFQLWAEGGVGVEHTRWDAGGTWTRPDLAVGLGGTILWAGEHSHLGMSAGIRFQLARRTDVAGAPAACAGPCDTATPPTGWDRAVLFDLAFLFGR